MEMQHSIVIVFAVRLCAPHENAYRWIEKKKEVNSRANVWKYNALHTHTHDIAQISNDRLIEICA